MKMAKTCQGKYQNLTQKPSSLVSSSALPHCRKSAETNPLIRNLYGYMDLHVGSYERKVEGHLSGEEYPVRDILMSDQE